MCVGFLKCSSVFRSQLKKSESQKQTHREHCVDRADKRTQFADLAPIVGLGLARARGGRGAA